MAVRSPRKREGAGSSPVWSSSVRGSVAQVAAHTVGIREVCGFEYRPILQFVAGGARAAVQSPCKRPRAGSSPVTGSKIDAAYVCAIRAVPGRHVNPFRRFDSSGVAVAEWSRRKVVALVTRVRIPAVTPEESGNKGEAVVLVRSPKPRPAGSTPAALANDL